MNDNNRLISQFRNQYRFNTGFLALGRARAALAATPLTSRLGDGVPIPSGRQNFASTSLTPLDQVGKATYEAISAGIDWTRAIDFMTQAESLNVAGKGELQSTTLALAGAINAYGGDVSKAADFSDTLFTAVKVGNIVLPELASGLGQVASLAATAGVPFSDLNAAIAAMTSYGVPAAEDMTQVRQAIVSILAPSDEAKKMAEALGIQFDAEALKANGLQGMLQLIYEKTVGNVAQ